MIRRPPRSTQSRSSAASDVYKRQAQRINQRQHSHPALQEAIEDVFNARIGDVSGRGKLAGDMREIWMMQPRFEKRVGSAPFGLVEQPRFRAAFDLSLIHISEPTRL